MLDTNVVSCLFGGHECAGFYQEILSKTTTYISFQTFAELQFRAVHRNWGNRKQMELDQHLAQYDMIWASSDLITAYAKLWAEQRQSGRDIESADAWIGATAIMLGYPLATHDKGFDTIPNLEVIRAPMHEAV